MSVFEQIVFHDEFLTGEGVDCETCGYTADRVAYYEYADGKFDLHISSGCTGGEFLTNGTVSEALELLDEYADIFASTNAVEEITRRLKAL